MSFSWSWNQWVSWNRLHVIRISCNYQQTMIFHFQYSWTNIRMIQTAVYESKSVSLTSPNAKHFWRWLVFWLFFVIQHRHVYRVTTWDKPDKPLYWTATILSITTYEVVRESPHLSTLLVLIIESTEFLAKASGRLKRYLITIDKKSHVDLLLFIYFSN